MKKGRLVRTAAFCTLLCATAFCVPAQGNSASAARPAELISDADAVIVQTGVQTFTVTSTANTDVQTVMRYTYIGRLSAPVRMVVNSRTVSAAAEAAPDAALQKMDAQAHVYRFSDCRSLGDPVMTVEFRIARRDTAVAAYGFDSVQWLDGEQTVRCTLDLTNDAAPTAYVVLTGYDMDAFNIFGYPDEAFSAPGDRDSVSARCLRYDVPLKDVLRSFARRLLPETCSSGTDAVAAELYPAIQHKEGRLCFLGQLEPLLEKAMDRPRQMTVAFPAVLPARQSVTVAVSAENG